MSETEFIELNVAGLCLDDVRFRLKRTTKMCRLKASYSERVGKEIHELRFIFDGHHIGDHQTPAELHMEQDDTIEVFQEQIGGQVVAMFIFCR